MNLKTLGIIILALKIIPTLAIGWILVVLADTHNQPPGQLGGITHGA